MNLRLIIPRRKAIPLESNTLCQECRRTVGPDTVVCPHCHAPIVRRYCAGCSHLIPEATKICPFCGNASRARPVIEAEPRGTKVLVVVVAVLALLALVLFKNAQDSPSEPVPQSSAKQQPAAPAKSEIPQPVPQAMHLNKDELPNVPAVRSDEEGARLNTKGHALIQAGKYDEAIEVLRLALRSFPEGTSAPSYKFTLYNLGHALRRAGLPEEAIPVLQQCIQIDSQWPKVVQELEMARQAAGKKKVT